MKERDRKFLKDIHNLDLASAPSNKPVNSLIAPSLVPSISANAYSNPTAVVAPNKPTGLYVYEFEGVAAMVPSGTTTPTGYSHHFYIAKAYMSYPEIIAIDNNYVNSAFDGIPGSSAD